MMFWIRRRKRCSRTSRRRPPKSSRRSRSGVESVRDAGKDEYAEAAALCLRVHASTSSLHGRGKSIAPFNFPATIPLWTIPLALVTGNTLVINPSERDPAATIIIAELCVRAAPSPHLRGREWHADAHIRAGHEEREARAVQRDHAVVMPDANKDQALSALPGAACGAAGRGAWRFLLRHRPLHTNQDDDALAVGRCAQQKGKQRRRGIGEYAGAKHRWRDISRAYNQAVEFGPLPPCGVYTHFILGDRQDLGAETNLPLIQIFVDGAKRSIGVKWFDHGIDTEITSLKKLM
ncbi:hypothetical protein K438DRAFT_1934497 [Mycena galopus ATCC 62051]|nr:hypothetical protein K438DRAFT_1934497 [Mycena galopus ATCC 62051]